MRAALVLAEANADAAKIKAATAGAEAARVAAKASSTEALIPHLKPGIEKLRCELFGSRSERKVPLLAQLELQLEGPGGDGDRG